MLNFVEIADGGGDLDNNMHRGGAKNRKVSKRLQWMGKMKEYKKSNFTKEFYQPCWAVFIASFEKFASHTVCPHD